MIAMASKIDEIFQDMLNKHILSETKKRLAKEANLAAWEDVVFSYLGNIRDSMRLVGMSSRDAIRIAHLKEHPEKADNEYRYLNYRLATTYKAAIEVSAFIVGTDNPWNAERLIGLLVVLDNDAYCFSDEIENHINAKIWTK